MDVVYLILLVLAAGAFALAVAGIPARINMLALGLLCWVLVPLLQQIHHMR